VLQTNLPIYQAKRGHHVEMGLLLFGQQYFRNENCDGSSNVLSMQTYITALINHFFDITIDTAVQVSTLLGLTADVNR
jgi:hypothetical protein